jgi:hypothetical protein
MPEIYCADCARESGAAAGVMASRGKFEVALVAESKFLETRLIQIKLFGT